MSLIISSFIAGLLMFLAPCTLPLVPGYLAFIGGVDLAEIQDKKAKSFIRKRIMINGLMYVIGFSLVFIIFGTLASFIGGRYLGQSRVILTQIGGVFVIVFGLFMLDIIKIPFLNKERKLHIPFLKKGNPQSSFLLGASFAFGWSPCIGPILATILLFASTSTTVIQGTFLLFVFSLGHAIPYLIIAWGIGSALRRINKLTKYMSVLSKTGGVFLIIIGVLLLTKNMSYLVSWGYSLLHFLNYERLLDYY